MFRRAISSRNGLNSASNVSRALAESPGRLIWDSMVRAAVRTSSSVMARIEASRLRRGGSSTSYRFLGPGSGISISRRLGGSNGLGVPSIQNCFATKLFSISHQIRITKSLGFFNRSSRLFASTNPKSISIFVFGSQPVIRKSLSHP